MRIRQSLEHSQLEVRTGPWTTDQADAIPSRSLAAFPISLCSIASHTSVPFNLRQSALLYLKTLVLSAWSPSLDNYKGEVTIDENVKPQIRDALLKIATSEDATDDRKVKAAASYVVSKIASADFPDQWPNLLPTLLHLIPTATPPQLHGALKVLSDLVEDGLSEEQFFAVARDLVKVVYDVSVDESRKPVLRALGASAKPVAPFLRDQANVQFHQ